MFLRSDDDELNVVGKLETPQAKVKHLSSVIFLASSSREARNRISQLEAAISPAARRLTQSLVQPCTASVLFKLIVLARSFPSAYKNIFLVQIT